MRARRAAQRSIAAVAALAAAPIGCNLVWGVDDLRFGGQTDTSIAGQGGAAGGTNGGATGAGASSAGGADGGSAAGAGGAGASGASSGLGGSGGPGSGGGGVEAVCGNGTREQGEQCDDDNTQSNDGCSSLCQMECPSNSFMSPSTFHCYLPSTSQNDWTYARDACQAVGAHLVTFGDYGEYDFVQDSLSPWEFDYYWIGARDSGSGYAWVTGEPFTFESWHPAEPDPSLCAFSGQATDEWFTAGCDSNDLYWVCEVEPAGE